MKNTVVFFFILLLSNHIVFSQIVINEVSINPASANDGSNMPNTAEWLELYNSGGASVDIGCWVIADGDFTITIPFGTTIVAGDYFTLSSASGSGFTPSLDWATCGCTTGAASQIGVFTNGSEQVALFDALSVVQDALIWGGGQALPDATNSSSALVGCPASNVALPLASSGIYENIGAQGNGILAKRQTDANTTWQNVAESAVTFGANNSAILPITLTNFTATPTNNKIELAWATATEFNSDYFKLNKSTDGEHYTTIGTVKSNNSNIGGDYTFYDNTPTLGTSYYTLTSVDFDGSQEISNVVATQYSGAQKAYRFYNYNHTLQIHPLNQTILSEINIYSLMGQLVQTIVVNNNSPVNIAVNELAKGMYYVQINAQNSSSTERFVVE